ncbi:MAG: hypothetical protein IT289_03980 [Oligoflexia bacterium]|nr:hypothetical protein [Oligoflexia bacterium]
MGNLKRSTILLAPLFAAALFLPVPASTNIIHLIDVVPLDQTDYSVSNELVQIRIATTIALKKARVLFPGCSIEVSKTLKTGTESELAELISELSKQADPQREVLVGISRSNFARVAAKASVGTKLEALSVGSATDQLASINDNFFSIASPWISQWRAVKLAIKKAQCREVTGVFDFTDHLSSKFKEAFKQDYPLSRVISFAEYQDLPLSSDCLFMAVNFQKSQGSLSRLLKSDRRISIFGIGDWNYYGSEVRNLVHETRNKKVVVQAPAGWKTNANSRSLQFSKVMKIKLGEDPSPVAAYAHDAILIVAQKLCEMKPLKAASITRFSKLPLLRKYNELASSNNFVSHMHMIDLNGVIQ